MKMPLMVLILFGTFIGQRQFQMFHCRQLDEPLRTDVAIIGAGFTGLSAAYHLGQAGVAITVTGCTASHVWRNGT